MGGGRTPDSRAQAEPDLHCEDVLAGVALQPQEPPVDVPHQRAAIKVRPQSAVGSLRDAPVRALGVDAAQQKARLGVQPSPRRTNGGLVARSEENGILLAPGGRAPGRDLQGSEVDLESEGASLLGLPAKSCTDERGTRAQRDRARDQEAL